MKAISIRQPWAWLILFGGKDVENRSWPTRVRGRVLIHAPKSMSQDDYDFALEFYGSAMPIEQDMERGGIVGSVEIVDCVTSAASQWFSGPYGFVLRNPEPLPFRPCRGKLGFFVPE